MKKLDTDFIKKLKNLGSRQHNMTKANKKRVNKNKHLSEEEFKKMVRAAQIKRYMKYRNKQNGSQHEPE